MTTNIIRPCRRYVETVAKEKVDGTIIDLETIGSFDDGEGVYRYRHMKPVAAGFFNGTEIEILYRTGDSSEDLLGLRDAVRAKLDRASRPFYAFNSDFEIGVLRWFLGEVVRFDRDLMLQIVYPSGRYVRESKRVLVRDLGIPNFDDPFCDDGAKVPVTWQQFTITGNFELLNHIIQHNRACLLKEHGILERRKTWRKVE